jgi:hypothetical protein
MPLSGPASANNRSEPSRGGREAKFKLLFLYFYSAIFGRLIMRVKLMAAALMAILVSVSTFHEFLSPPVRVPLRR